MPRCAQDVLTSAGLEARQDFVYHVPSLQLEIRPSKAPSLNACSSAKTKAKETNVCVRVRIAFCAFFLLLRICFNCCGSCSISRKREITFLPVVFRVDSAGVAVKAAQSTWNLKGDPWQMGMWNRTSCHLM